MRCMNCEADIPPQWINALQSNECPGCGGEIMNKSAKELLDELTHAMERMPNNPQGIAGWLLSNYQFRKIGDAAPTERFHTKRGDVRRQKNETEESYNLRVADNPVQALLKRTDSYKNIQATRAKLVRDGDNIDQLAAMAAGIADVDGDMYGSGTDLDEEYDDGDEVVAERGPRLSRQLATGASLVDATAQPLTPEELEALAGSVHAEEDTDTAHKVLQMQRLKRLKAQQDVADGGGMGVFRRGG